MTGGENPADPRVYMAAERTFLAWVRTALALMALGFVVARFGVLLRTLAGQPAPAGPRSQESLALGLGLIALGAAVCAFSAHRHGRYVRGLDEGRFRAAFGSRAAYALASLLVLVAAGLALFLATL